jgi:hypothetical protein
MSEDQIKKEFERLKQQIKEMEVVIRHLKRQIRK